MRVLIVSDIHANLVALETVLTAVKGQYDVLWCLGDVVGYGPRPNECIQLMQDQAQICVMGNHDWATLDMPGINVDDFNPQARSAVLWTREQLSEPCREYLRAMPYVPVRPPSLDNFLITHASPREPVWEYVLTPSIAMENFSVFMEHVCLVGHTHKPAIYRWQLVDTSAFLDQASGSNNPNDETEHGGQPYVPKSEQETSESVSANPSSESVAEKANGTVTKMEWVATVDQIMPDTGVKVEIKPNESERLIINPGSVGQPRDNDPRAAYAILDLEDMTWQFERIVYPVELTQAQMKEANLPKRLIDRLSFGW